MLERLGFYFAMGLVVLLGVIVIPNLDQLQEKLGFQTRASLLQDQQQLEDQIVQVLETNHQNVEQLEQATIIQQQSDIVTVEAVKEIAQKTTEVKQIRKTTQRVIKTTPVEQVDEISKANISSLWATYHTLKDQS